MLSLTAREKIYLLVMIRDNVDKFPNGDVILSEAQRNDLFSKVVEMETEEC